MKETSGLWTELGRWGEGISVIFVYLEDQDITDSAKSAAVVDVEQSINYLRQRATRIN